MSFNAGSQLWKAKKKGFIDGFSANIWKAVMFLDREENARFLETAQSADMFLEQALQSSWSNQLGPVRDEKTENTNVIERLQ